MWHVWRSEMGAGFVGKPEGKRKLGRRRHRCGLVMKWIVKRKDWIHTAHYTNKRRAYVNAGMKFRVL
jgi:hypothetical protein